MFQKEQLRQARNPDFDPESYIEQLYNDYFIQNEKLINMAEKEASGQMTLIASTAAGSKDYMAQQNSIFDPVNATLSKELY